MSPESVNGVAEIVYTPFADESSRWLIVLALLRFAVCGECSQNKCIPRIGRKSNRSPPSSASRLSTHCDVLRAHAPCPPSPGCYSPWCPPYPLEGELHEPLCAFDCRRGLASRHVSVCSGAATAACGSRWHFRTACLSESFRRLSRLQR